jgi:hypothetical protein
MSLLHNGSLVGIGEKTPREALTVAGNISASGGLSAASICAAATTNGFVSAGRDLADIFATSSGNVDGTGTACYLPVFSDTNTICNSIACESSTQLTVAGSISAQGSLSASYIGIDDYIRHRYHHSGECSRQ